jgi:hypothetical protein
MAKILPFRIPGQSCSNCRYYVLTVFLLLLFLGCSGLMTVKEEYYESGRLKSKVKIINGKREGKCKFYHRSGKLKSVWNYKNGKLEFDKNSP